MADDDKHFNSVNSEAVECRVEYRDRVYPRQFDKTYNDIIIMQ